MSLAVAKNTGVVAAVAALLSELDGIFTLKEEQRTALRAFLGGQDVGKSFDKHRGTSQLAIGW